MSANNGVIRIGRKGLKKFAFGDDGPPFEVDVVIAFQQWVTIDDGFRVKNPEGDGRTIPVERMVEYHQAAVGFAYEFAGPTEADQLADSMSRQMGYPVKSIDSITTAEALDFIARLREEYDELADFFQPKLRERPGSRDTSEPALRFSVEGQS